MSAGLLKDTYPPEKEEKVLYLVTAILPACFPLKASSVIVRVAALPDPLMAIRQGEVEPVSKSPLVSSEPNTSPNAVCTSVKPRRKSISTARIFEVLMPAKFEFFRSNVTSSELFTQKPDDKRWCSDDAHKNTWRRREF